MTIDRQDPERAPTPPGVYVAEDILDECGLTQGQLAAALGVSRRTVSQLVNGHRGITANMALRLGKLTGTSAQFWINLQTATDLWTVRHESAEALGRITPLTSAA